MRIEFRQTGGVAGIPRRPVVIDTAQLSPDQAQRWHDLVAAADLFNLPAVSPLGSRRDPFVYQITVDADGRRAAIQTHSGAASPGLNALIEALRHEASWPAG